VSGDRIVALVGIAMALILVLSNLRLKQQPIGAKLWMLGAWLAIIVVAALAFAGFERKTLALFNIIIIIKPKDRLYEPRR